MNRTPSSTWLPVTAKSVRCWRASRSAVAARDLEGSCSSGSSQRETASLVVERLRIKARPVSQRNSCDRTHI